MINRIVFTRRTLSNILCILTFSLPIFRYYDLFSTGLGLETILTLLMVAICLVMFYIGRGHRHTVYTVLRRSQIWFGALVFWLLLVTCAYELFTEINIDNPNAQHTIISLIMIVFRAIVIGYLLGGDFDYRDIFRIYSCLVGIIIAIYFLQWIMVLAGIRMSFKMPFLPYNNAYDYLNGMVNFGMEPDPTSLFSERAHLAEFILPYIAVCLFGKGIIKKHATVKAVAVTAVILTTVSGVGLVVVLIEWFLYFLGIGQKKSKYRFFYFIFGVCALIGVYFAIRQIPAVNEMLNRLFVDNSGNDYSGTKADYRIYRGFDMFTLLPAYAQIFGIGYNHMWLFAQVNGIVSQYDKASLAYEFFATIFQIAIYSGLIGLSCALLHIYNLLKSNSALARVLVIIMFAIWFSSAMFLTNSHIVFIMLIIAAVYYDNKPSEAKS